MIDAFVDKLLQSADGRLVPSEQVGDITQQLMSQFQEGDRIHVHYILSRSEDKKEAKKQFINIYIYIYICIYNMMYTYPLLLY